MNQIPAQQPGSTGLPLETDVLTAATLLQSPTPPLLLDVREDDERAFCRVGSAGELHIPIGQIPQCWQSLPGDRHLLVYCHHGMRSLRVTQFLRQAGLDKVQSIRGGIDAWSVSVDPSVPRY